MTLFHQRLAGRRKKTGRQGGGMRPNSRPKRICPDARRHSACAPQVKCEGAKMGRSSIIFLVDAVLRGGIHWVAAAFWCKERALQR